MSEARQTLARRYVGWLRRASLLVIAAWTLVVAGAGYLVAFHLPLHADFAYLLPPDAPSVRDLRRLESRVRTQDTVLVIVIADDPEVRAAAAAELATRLRALPPTLIAQVEDDDRPLRDYLRAHRELLAPLDLLEQARAVLAEQIEHAKISANPAYIDLDDDEAAARTARLDALKARRAEGQALVDHSRYVSKDQRHQLLVVRSGFPKTSITDGERLLHELARARTAVIAAHPGVEIGLSGGVVNAVAEHHALERGILLSSLITAVLVGLVIALYFRSAVLLIVLTAALVAATVIAFGAAALTVGHLNAATAFLGAIIAGNGVNYGILLIARYLEERRHLDADDALATALWGTVRPTLVAALGASIAYGSLAATSFRGFADFAVIGAVGMMVCWVVSYTLLPALLVRLPAPRVHAGPPVLGSALARLLGFRHPGRVLLAALAVAIGAGAVTWKYVAADPFEYDLRRLRSEGPEAVEGRKWLKISDENFGRGISGVTYVAADDDRQVPEIVAALTRKVPGVTPAIGTVRSVLDLVPTVEDQAAKRAVLKELRAMLEDDALDVLDDDDRAQLEELKPPPDEELAPLTIAGLPPALAEPLREVDGRVGLLIAVRPDTSIDEWNGRDMIRFAAAVRRIDLGADGTVTTSGPSVIFADILATIRRDGVRVTAIAAVGLIFMVLLVVGPNRRTAAVLAATGLGALALVATSALLGLKVNFLDFVALPITLGLGVDYAINVAHRHDREDHDPIATLRSSGSAVFVCSLTTIIGYGSLLVSENQAISGFGLASLIGEVACVTTALVVVPAMVAWRRAPAVSSAP